MIKRGLYLENNILIYDNLQYIEDDKIARLQLLTDFESFWQY